MVIIPTLYLAFRIPPLRSKEKIVATQSNIISLMTLQMCFNKFITPSGYLPVFNN